MKQVIKFFFIFLIIVVNAQEVEELNGKFYKIDTGKSPFDKVKVLKRNSVNEGYNSVILKKGKYRCSKNTSTITFLITEEQLIKEGELEIGTPDKKMIGFIKNGLIEKIEAYNKDKLAFLLESNHNDSIVYTNYYHVNGNKKKDELQFFTTKNFKKKIITTYNKDGSYTIYNEIKGTLKSYNTKGVFVNKKKQKYPITKVVDSVEEVVENTVTDYSFNHLFDVELVGLSKKQYNEFYIDKVSVCKCNTHSILIDTKQDNVYLFNYCKDALPPKTKKHYASYVLDDIVVDNDQLTVYTHNKAGEELIYIFSKTSTSNVYGVATVGTIPTKYIASRMCKFFTDTPNTFKKVICKKGE